MHAHRYAVPLRGRQRAIEPTSEHAYQRVSIRKDTSTPVFGYESKSQASISDAIRSHMRGPEIAREIPPVAQIQATLWCQVLGGLLLRGDCGRCSLASRSVLPAPAVRTRAGLHLDPGCAPAGSAPVRSRPKCERPLIGAGSRVGGGPGVACPKSWRFGV